MTTIHRIAAKSANYTIIDNRPPNDTRLSYTALGLWTYLMTKPDDWTIRMANLVRTGSSGRRIVRSAIRELEEFGYMTRRESRLADGKIDVRIDVFEEPRKCVKSKPQAACGRRKAVSRARSAESGLVLSNNNQELITNCAATAAESSKAKDSAHKTVVGWWMNAWAERYGDKYAFTSRDGKAIKVALAKCDGDSDKAIRLLSAYLKDEDRWVREGRHTLLRLDANRYPLTLPAQKPLVMPKAIEMDI